MAAEKRLSASDSVDKYILEAEEFARPICIKLRKIILNSTPGMTEECKWGPNFQDNGMVCGFGAFKEHVTLTFFKGALLSDPENILKEGSSNLHNRSVKFKNEKEVNSKIIKSYVKEAVNLNNSGIKIEKRTPEIPELLSNEFRKNKNLEAVFNKLTFTEKKEYIISLTEAKKEATKLHRLNRIIEILKDKKGGE